MKKTLFYFLLIIASASSGWACDSCGCEFCDPGSQSTGGFWSSAVGTVPESYFFARVSEQYTDFNTLRVEGTKVDNPMDQYEHSSITQFIVGYQFNQSFDVTVSLPYIYRAYQIPNLSNTGTVHGQANGIGDMSLVANYIVLRDEQKDWGYSWRVSAGVKLPTGDPNLLNQEIPGAAPSELNSDNSAIGGHDLALGSGSYDGIVGTGINANWDRLFATADMDYAIRGTGHDGYRYANEFSWSGGPGCRVWQTPDYTLSLQLLASGEYKGADTIQNTVTDDTSMTSVMLGPKVLFTCSKGISVNFGVDLPVVQHSTGFQAVPTYRIKAGLTFQF